MQIAMNAIIPITDATKHFKTACEKTKELGTTFIFKNNRPDIVMMDIGSYERFMSVLEDMEQSEIAALVAKRRNKDNGKRFSLDEVVT
ncbi:MAG: type II toxin-antitoxin system Phd/YefM family antitoxin [Oscillospiraceae bacterium]|nr:type II toxin-antitoxin system Phd/YefM family antitoxin [Oscillospiraceae bacterium]